MLTKFIGQQTDYRTVSLKPLLELAKIKSDFVLLTFLLFIYFCQQQTTYLHVNTNVKKWLLLVFVSLLSTATNFT